MPTDCCSNLFFNTEGLEFFLGFLALCKVFKGFFFVIYYEIKTSYKMMQTISAPAGNLCVMLFFDTQIKQKPHKMNRGSGLVAAGFFFYAVLHIGIVLLLSLYRK